MEPSRVAGDAFLLFARALYLNDSGWSDFSELSNWCEPLNFWPRSNVLRETDGGPWRFSQRFRRTSHL
jgi:hypothetical protein